NFGNAAAGPGNPNTSTALNPQHRYTAAGNYNVKLVATSNQGCKDSTTQMLVVNGDNPRPDFLVTNVDNLCVNQLVEITNKSTVNFGRVTKLEIFWNWPSAADRTVDDDPDFDKKYAFRYNTFHAPEFRDVQVRMLAYSGGVCVNEVIKTIRLYAAPQVQFTTMPGICLDAPARQITQATDAANLPGSFVYSGTGVSTTGLFNPQTAGVGTYPIKYIYTSNMGCKDSATQSITVWPKPVAGFSISAPACETRNLTFTDTSRAMVGQIAQWQWNFGLGGPDTVRTSGAPFTYAYANTGNYNVQLTITTDSGCTSQPVTRALRINPLPVVNFDLPVVCLPEGRAAFTNRTTIADGTQAQLTYNWNFGVPGGTSNQANPVYNYSSNGPFNVTLTATSNNGCAQSLTRQLTDVNPQPLASISVAPLEVCLGETIRLEDRSNPLGQTVTAYNWQFGNGQGSSQQNTSVTYTQAGTYQVLFFYTTAKGCHSDTVS
ncbi:MAG TPA: PKD domain-containing protein, partial [Phnomibacter sp.]|nr:PKD domain-containing protein [Phnomibacter sp.]